MLIFQRKIEEKIKKRLFLGRAILLFGPRQAGKTTLSKKLLKEFGERGAYFNCEIVEVRQSFVLGEPKKLKELTGNKQVVVFDEAQTIQDIGAILKTFIDTYPDIQIIATGSSSFDLANKINEPLTGRAFEFTLYPLSLVEIQLAYPDTTRETLDELLILGSYPAVVAEKNKAIKKDILKNLATSYLYKDVYMFESIRNPRSFEKLVYILALQAGSLVSMNELAQTLNMTRATVEKYIRLLEQSYVIKVIHSFSRNPRTEVKKAFKVFFLDNGVRNAIINNLSDMNAREDQGALFENFFTSERLKYTANNDQWTHIMFWRSRQGEEIDLIEESGGVIRAFECKWNDKNEISAPRQFTKAYPKAVFQTITPKSLLQ